MSFINKVKDKNNVSYDIHDERVPEILAENEGKILKVQGGELTFADAPSGGLKLYGHTIVLHGDTDMTLYIASFESTECSELSKVAVLMEAGFFNQISFTNFKSLQIDNNAHYELKATSYSYETGNVLYRVIESVDTSDNEFKANVLKMGTDVTFVSDTVTEL